MQNAVTEQIYTHLILEGSHYDAGRKQTAVFAKKPGFTQWFCTAAANGNGLSDDDFSRTRKIFDEYCPGINEEIEGMADELAVRPRDIAYYALTHSQKGSCSHFALLPPLTENGHTLVGRSYEWNLQDDFTLCTTRVKDKASHIGFTALALGRFEGLNEHGLCVTMSAAAPMRPVLGEGIKFWALIRILLDNCRNVDEALETVKRCPVSFFLNLIVADKDSGAALIEIAEDRRAFKRIGGAYGGNALYATNHFNLEGMQHETTRRMRMSINRYETMVRRLSETGPKISTAQIKSLLSGKMPDGLCAHHYSDYFGTLWSMLFDLDTGCIDICMGSPQMNQWRNYSLHTDSPAGEFICKLPDEKPDPGIFEHVSI